MTGHDELDDPATVNTVVTGRPDTVGAAVMAGPDRPALERGRHDGVDDATVEAVGRLTEALESTERARGHLYSFPQLTGEADFKIGDATAELRRAGHTDLAGRIEREIVGRTVLPGRWTFQIIEEYDYGYWTALCDIEREVRHTLLQGRRHIAETELRDHRRTSGQPGHAHLPTSETQP